MQLPRRPRRLTKWLLALPATLLIAAGLWLGQGLHQADTAARDDSFTTFAYWEQRGIPPSVPTPGTKQPATNLSGR